MYSEEQVLEMTNDEFMELVVDAWVDEWAREAAEEELAIAEGLAVR